METSNKCSIGCKSSLQCCNRVVIAITRFNITEFFMELHQIIRLKDETSKSKRFTETDYRRLSFNRSRDIREIETRNCFLTIYLFRQKRWPFRALFEITFQKVEIFFITLCFVSSLKKLLNWGFTGYNFSSTDGFSFSKMKFNLQCRDKLKFLNWHTVCFKMFCNAHENTIKNV